MVVRSIATLLALTLFGWPHIGAAASNDALSRWFQSGQCPAFNAIAAAKVPYARNDAERLEWMGRFTAGFRPSGNAAYIYDPRVTEPFFEVWDSSESLISCIDVDSSAMRT